MPRVIFHVDMDAFYASVEQREEPAYRGQPLIVGGNPQKRGVVCAASYEARKFGVRSAMPSRTAAALCPTGIFIRPRMDLYRTESRLVMGILEDTGAIVEQVSVDEAYLDLSERFAGMEPDEALEAAVPVARGIKERIAHERRLTASIGVAGNKFLAKVGSDLQKPNGLTLIPERGKAEWLRPLEVKRIPGVGPVTANALQAMDILTIGDLQDTELDLTRAVGSFAWRLRDLAVGKDDRPLDLTDDRKSISSETTFSEDTAHRPTLRAALREHAADIEKTLQKYSMGALTVQVKVRYGNFQTLTRQLRVEEPLTTKEEIYRLGCYLLARDRLVTRPLRLLGLGVSHLRMPSAQLHFELAEGGGALRAR